MTSRILNRFNIKTDRLLRSIATDKLSCDIHPRKMIKLVRRVSRDHIIMGSIMCEFHNTQHNTQITFNFKYANVFGLPLCVKVVKWVWEILKKIWLKPKGMNRFGGNY